MTEERTFENVPRVPNKVEQKQIATLNSALMIPQMCFLYLIKNGIFHYFAKSSSSFQRQVIVAQTSWNNNIMC
jgi:hypothetical protein